MRAFPFSVLPTLLAAGLLAGCGGPSPIEPSSSLSVVSGLGVAATQTVIGTAVTQSAMTSATTVSPDGLSRTVVFPCPGGGSRSMIFAGTAGVPSNTFTSSSRVEFNDCRMENVTINGDPAILMEGTHTFGPLVGGTPSTMTATTRMTGGLRFDAAGVLGKAKYDCTMVMSMQISNGTPTLPAVTSSGTITWEQPLGTVIVRPCGG